MERDGFHVREKTGCSEEWKEEESIRVWKFDEARGGGQGGVGEAGG